MEKSDAKLGCTSGGHPRPRSGKGWTQGPQSGGPKVRGRVTWSRSVAPPSPLEPEEEKEEGEGEGEKGDGEEGEQTVEQPTVWVRGLCDYLTG